MINCQFTLELYEQSALLDCTMFNIPSVNDM